MATRCVARRGLTIRSATGPGRSEPLPEEHGDQDEVDGVTTVVHDHRATAGLLDGDTGGRAGVQRLRQDGMCGQRDQQDHRAWREPQAVRRGIDADEGEREQVPGTQHMGVHQHVDGQAVIHAAVQAGAVQQPQPTDVEQRGGQRVGEQAHRCGREQSRQPPGPQRGKPAQRQGQRCRQHQQQWRQHAQQQMTDHVGGKVVVGPLGQRPDQ